MDLTSARSARSARFECTRCPSFSTDSSDSFWEHQRDVHGARLHTAQVPDAGCSFPASTVPGWFPPLDEDPTWTVVIEGDDPTTRAHNETITTLGNGWFGTRGAREEGGAATTPLVQAAGVFETQAGNPTLLAAPLWAGLVIPPTVGTHERRILDLRNGTLRRELAGPAGTVRTMRFVSLARPGVMVLRAGGPAHLLGAGRALSPAPGQSGYSHGMLSSGRPWARTASHLGGAVTAAAADRVMVAGGTRRIERVAAYVADGARIPTTAEANDLLTTATGDGFDTLYAEQQAAWAARWADCDVTIEGDPAATMAVRFGLFHLLGSVADHGEAGVGARGLSGQDYSGHVFWDADVFVLPTMAATRPAAARAMLAYRLARLGDARRATAAAGRRGARFPWESAITGYDVTPTWVRDGRGAVVPIRTGGLEEHVSADVAWAAVHYLEWTDDRELAGEIAELVCDTARYWASRIRVDGAGAGHIYGVIGPDEYHEPVDDSAYTNMMARWNLRTAARLGAEAGCAGVEEAARWLSLADALIDGYDPVTARHEQHAGFYHLDPFVVADVVRRPVCGDSLLPLAQVRSCQMIKQADVVLAHHLLPGDMPTASLHPDLEYYEPRTAHGSSLSPAIYAAQLARDGQLDKALVWFRISARLDLDDLTGTSGGGLHIATMGGVWQALVYGFVGLRPQGDGLVIDPHLPEEWTAVNVTVRHHGQRVVVRAEADTVTVTVERPLTVTVGAAAAVTVPGGTTRIELPLHANEVVEAA